MESPLVSVVCLCYNQERFVKTAIESVLDQTYPNVQLIVVDDASTDNSVHVIKSVLALYPQVQFLELKENLGNCRAFNKGLALTKGSFIIDLAADDVLLPNRVEEGVAALNKATSYGIHFSDAAIIDQHDTLLYKHSDRFPHHTVPQGNVYVDVVRRYFICPPTVMFTREVANALGGYDETLSYEDFDFWVRSSRMFGYVYSPEVLVKRRVSENTLGAKQFKFFSRHSTSTYQVCKKILRLNNSREEQQALHHRIAYEIGLNLRLLNILTAFRFLFLLLRNAGKKYT